MDPPVYQSVDIKSTLETARKALDEREVQAAWEHGKSMEIESAVHFALGEA